MTRRASAVPGKLTVAGARVGVIVAGLLLIFGVAFGFVVLQAPGSSELGMQILIGLFFMIWIVACGSLIAFFGRVAFGKAGTDGNSLIDVTFDERQSRSPETKRPPSDADC